MRQGTLEGRPDGPTLVVRGYAVTHPSGTVVLPTSPEWDQLLYASSGAMTVETQEGTWVLPPHRALWAPSGTAFRIVMHGTVSVRTLYLRTGLRAMPGELRVISVPPLARELILYAVRNSPLDTAVPEHDRLVGVLLDQVGPLAQAPLQLPLPTDPRARALATALIDHPTDVLDDLVAACGASRRTLERAFRNDTGMTIGAWRRRQRIAHALRLLAEGQAVTSVAYAVGYSTPSAFGAMFRQELGTTPARYFAA